MADTKPQVNMDELIPTPDKLVAGMGTQPHTTTQSTMLLDPEGNLVQGPTALVSTALQTGYKLATPENITDIANQKKYGEGWINSTKAALLGAGEGASFGLSTAGLVGGAKLLGLDDPSEAIGEIEKRNPGAHIAGEIGGVLGSSFLPGGGLVGGAAKLGNMAAAGAGELGAKAIGALAGEGSTAAKVLGYANQVGSSALGSAIEGSLYSGVGNTVTEAALGDPDLNAEKIMSNFGYGALLGGTIGGAIKAGEIVVPPVYNAAKNATSSIIGSAKNKLADYISPETIPASTGAADAIRPFPNFPSKNDLLTKPLDEEAAQALAKKDTQLAMDAHVAAATQKTKEVLESGEHGMLGHVLEMGAIVHNPLLAPLIETGKMIATPELAFSRLINLERIINKSTNALESGVKNIFNASKPAIETTTGLASQNASDALMNAEHDAYVSKLNGLVNNPEALVNQVTAGTDPIHHVAPNLAGSLNNGVSRATMYLQSKIPQEQPSGILNDKMYPSRQEISNFDRHLSLIENPLAILSNVKDGTLTPSDIETVSTAYPRMYAQMQERVLDHLSSMKSFDSIPYHQRMTLSMMMGQPLDNSLSPSNLAANQQVFALPQAQPIHSSKQKQATSKFQKLQLSNRFMTPFQQSADRESRA